MDYKLTVKIIIVGPVKDVKIDWHLNWCKDQPELLYREIIKAAKETGLDVDDKTYLFDDE